MANEAKLLVQLEPAINFTCADGTGIEKGAVLKLTHPMTASLSTAASDYIAGICVGEKIANNGINHVAVCRRGIYRMYCSGSITAGESVGPCISTDFPNYVMRAGVTISGSAIIGHALETATAGNTFKVFLNVGGGGNQIS